MHSSSCSPNIILAAWAVFFFSLFSQPQNGFDTQVDPTLQVFTLGWSTLFGSSQHPLSCVTLLFGIPPNLWPPKNSNHLSGLFFPGQAGGCLKIRDIFLRNSGRFGHVLFQGAFLVALKGTQPESRQSKSQTCATSKSHGWSLVQLSPDFIQSNTTWSSPSPVPSEK